MAWKLDRPAPAGLLNDRPALCQMSAVLPPVSRPEVDDGSDDRPVQQAAEQTRQVPVQQGPDDTEQHWWPDDE